jgi:hypothetical protein
MPNSAVERGSVMKLSFPAICLPQPISWPFLHGWRQSTCVSPHFTLKNIIAGMGRWLWGP